MTQRFAMGMFAALTTLPNSKLGISEA